MSVLGREGGCIPGHGGWVTLVPGHTHMTQGEYVYLYHPRPHSCTSCTLTSGHGGSSGGRGDTGHRACEVYVSKYILGIIVWYYDINE